MLPSCRELAVVLCAEGFFVGCACCREKFAEREGGRYWGMLRFLTRGESSGSRSGCIRPPRQTASSATPSVSRQKTTQLQSLLDNTWLCEKNALWGFPLLSPAAAPPCALLRLAEGFTHPLSRDNIGRQLLHTLPRRVIQCSHCSLADL